MAEEETHLYTVCERVVEDLMQSVGCGLVYCYHHVSVLHIELIGVSGGRGGGQSTQPL